MHVTITHIDTACILIEINGYTILTDPTLDAAGRLYYHGSGSFSRKTGNPAMSPDALKNTDLVLLSHHQHKDNFDIKGKELTATLPLVLSTVPASKAYENITGLKEWETYAVNTPLVPGLRITAVPAQHHPWWVPEFFSGKVIGFIIEYDAQQNGVLYISGDTVYFKGIEEIAKRFNVDIAVLHVGAVQFRYLTGFGRYTMNSKDLLRSVKVIQPATVIPIHYKGWSHFKETEQHLRSAIGGEEWLNKKTLFLQPGIPQVI